MILGSVDADGIPFVTLLVAGQSWRAVVDSGFNGDLELPDALRPSVNPRYRGLAESVLAGAQAVFEDYYEVDFPFDGRTVVAEATFVPGNEILIGTQLLQQYRLEINFPARTVLIERVP
jgi:predicted aspartyl protease